MTVVRLAHTSKLSDATLKAARGLLFEVFDRDFSDEDWAHTVGGLHALVWEGDELIGHAALVERVLTVDGRPLRCGYVEGVGVRADRRRRGHAGAMMAEFEDIVRREYDLGALSSSDEATDFYLSRGWRPWQGPTSVLAPEGVVATPDDDGGVFVWEAGVPLDPALPLTCDWRDGDVW